MKKTHFSKRLLSILMVLAMALSLLPAATMAATAPTVDEMTVVISMEGLTLGQGMYVEPTAYTLTEINELVGTMGYGPYTKETLTAAMATLAMVIDYDLETNMTGDWEDSFYLSEVKGLDTGTVDIPDIIGENGGPTNDENDGNDDEWLGEFDYSWMSGWMISVNNNMIPVGAAGYDFQGYRDGGTGEDYGDLYVVRWMFSAYGYGGDLGIGGGWMPPYFTAANKDMLYAAYAMAGNLSSKAAALTVMENLTATQDEVDAVSLAKWEDPNTTTSYWPSFRGSDNNMAITNTMTPHDSSTTVLKWAAKLGSSWTAAPSVQIIADDALISMSGTTIYKLDLQTGETIDTGTMNTSSSWGYTPPIYADGLIVCPLGGGKLQAFDAETLDSVWLFTDELGGQANTPIAYSEGKVYTGFWNGETRDANIVCVDTSDGSLVWKKTVPGGCYWAGGVVVGDALVIGSDDGADGWEGDSHLFSLNKDNGEVITDLTLTGCGDQRSTVSYSADKGRVYLTTKNGYICSAALNATTGELSDLKTVKHGSAQSTSTPLVYGDKVYYCCGSGVISDSNGAGNFVVADADSLEMLYSVALKAYPQASTLLSTAYYETEGKLYFYNTYNGTPGGISLIRVDPTKNDASGAELEEIYDAKGYEQYCIASPICGPDGTIYYKNDSGNVLAVGSNFAYLTGLTGDVGAQTGVFNGGAANIEWVVPIGTASVTLTPTVSEGSTFTIDQPTVTLTDGTGTATITVVNGTDERTYTVSIREISNNADLDGVDVNERNYPSSPLDMTPTFDKDTYYYGVYTAGDSRSFMNLWPYVSDSKASVKVYAISGVSADTYDADTKEIPVTATYYTGDDRYALYFADDAQPMAVRIVVTAENGDQMQYTLVITKAAAAEAGAALLEQIAADDADKAAAAVVVEQIAAIGTVTLDSEAAIVAAREAYDALTDAQKALVTNLDVLVAAEAELDALNNPQTGENDLIIWMSVLAVLCVACVTVMTFAKKKYV